MGSKVEELLRGHRDAITVGRVFGDPYERDGVTVIPAARVMGGGGGGEATQDEGTGSGSGYGMVAWPAGAFVVSGGDVRWQPAVDVNRIVAGAFALAALALLVTARRGRG